MDEAEIAKCLNEWMRRFIDEPEQFAGEFEGVKEFMAEEASGVEPSYGTVGAAYMAQLSAELAA